MEGLTPIEIRVRTRVDDFFANRIKANKFKKELTKSEIRFIRKQRTLPRARGKTFSWTLILVTRGSHLVSATREAWRCFRQGLDC
jgi:hypothetical protein